MLRFAGITSKTCIAWLFHNEMPPKNSNFSLAGDAGLAKTSVSRDVYGRGWRMGFCEDFHTPKGSADKNWVENGLMK